jgi:hypothetical protein
MEQDPKTPPARPFWRVQRAGQLAMQCALSALPGGGVVMRLWRGGMLQLTETFPDWHRATEWAVDVRNALISLGWQETAESRRRRGTRV